MNNPIFKTLGSSSHSKEEREINDYYATNPKAIDDLLRYETLSCNIWEPACGGGQLVKRLREKGYSVFATDIIDRGCSDELFDFLSGDRKEKWDGDILTNPPYKYSTQFILRALNFVKTGHKVFMFLKLLTLEGQERYKKIYKDNPPKNIYVYVKRIECGKDGVFTGGSAICYSWFVWEKGYKGDTFLKWITD